MRTFLRVLAVLFLTFVGLFLVRFVLGYFIEFDRYSRDAVGFQAVAGLSMPSKIDYHKAVSSNVERFKEGSGGEFTSEQLAQLEVFAKEANLSGTTMAFDTDQERVREAIRENDATIRLERREGLRPRRSLQLVLKVPEDNFAVLTAQLKTVGKVQDMSVVKEDKTQEVKAIHARLAALQKHHDALAKLRGRDGTVDDLAELEQKILSVQQQLQQTRGQFGELVQAKSYHNILYSLQEVYRLPVGDEVYSLGERVLDALEWTIVWYFLAVFVVGGIVLAVLSVRVLLPKHGPA